MPLPLPEPFERFAADCGLRLAFEPLCSAPRDVLIPIEEAERHFVVTLHVQGRDSPGVRVIFAVPLASGATPGMRDVLWWLAGDAWAVERSRGEPDLWAATFGYPPRHPGVAQLFDCHARQCAALLALLGREAYDRLIALYDAEIKAPSRRP
jgi:hypothetical protein